jgi:hypothetical protein
MTGYLVAAGILLVLAYCGLVLLIEVFAKWSIQREAERTAAATFEADYIPEAPDVVEQERALLEAGLIAGLEQVEAEWEAHCAAVRRETA